MKKINVKTLSVKQKVCGSCGMQKTCNDLFGFCVMLYYVPIVLVVATATYFILSK